MQVMAAGINPVDYKMGRFLGQVLDTSLMWVFYQVVGMDVAGVVESIGQGVTSLQVKGTGLKNPRWEMKCLGSSLAASQSMLLLKLQLWERR